jgi:3-oxoacyl-[acyl-carrier-protein] synthase II
MDCEEGARNREDMRSGQDMRNRERMGDRECARVRVVITGIGAITPLGATARQTWENVLAGKSAARDWEDLAAEGHRVVRACRIENFDAEDTRRGRALGIAAAREALEHSGLADVLRENRGDSGVAARSTRGGTNSGGMFTVPPSSPSAKRGLPEEGGIFIGSTLGESAAFERVGAGGSLHLPDHGVPSFCDGIAAEFGLTGPRESLATACAAGNYAIGAGVLALRQRRASFALAGGVEPFSRLSMVGFARSRAMASGDCKPFDAHRTGMLLGEGAGILVLERLDDALVRGAKPLAEVMGLGLSSDAYHPTAPRPDGRGMARAMRAALQEAGVTPSDVDWVNLHGTGTRASDSAEGRALMELFEGLVPPSLSGSKGALGHALGAASAIEAVLCVAGLCDQLVPPTRGHEQMDPEIGLACTRDRSEPARAPMRVVMNNAFAFGGINSALVLSRWAAA